MTRGSKLSKTVNKQSEIDKYQIVSENTEREGWTVVKGVLCQLCMLAGSAEGGGDRITSLRLAWATHLGKKVYCFCRRPYLLVPMMAAHRHL